MKRLTHGLASVCFGGAIGLSTSGAATAQTVVPFDGTVLASCILSISSSGALGTNVNATELGSEQTGGRAATLAVTATGLTPTIEFSAPTMTAKPAGYTGAPTLSLRYTSTGGANQSYTSAATSYRSNNLLSDAITVHAKAADAAGFAAGNYTVQTVVTCQQQ